MPRIYNDPPEEHTNYNQLNFNNNRRGNYNYNYNPYNNYNSNNYAYIPPSLHQYLAPAAQQQAQQQQAQQQQNQQQNQQNQPLQRRGRIPELTEAALGKNARRLDKCFNPISYSYEDIEQSHTVFYIINEKGKVQNIACLDEDSINYYKSTADYIFHQCTLNTNAGSGGLPLTSLYIQKQHLIGKPLRKLDFGTKVYVLDSEFQQVESGGAYMLIPTTNKLGRIVSEKVLTEHNVVSGDHCQTVFKDPIYKIYILDDKKPSDTLLYKVGDKIRHIFKTPYNFNNNNVNEGALGVMGTNNNMQKMFTTPYNVNYNNTKKNNKGNANRNNSNRNNRNNNINSIALSNNTNSNRNNNSITLSNNNRNNTS